MPRPSEINPAADVWDSEIKQHMVENATPFEITRVSSFRSPRYGATWRIHTTLLDSTRAHGLLLFAKNDVRDDAYGGFAASLESDGEPIGPCKLITRTLANNRQTWEIVDADETPTATK